MRQNRSPARPHSAFRRDQFVMNFDPTVNPFDVPDDDDILETREKEAALQRTEHEINKKKTLMERNCPSLPGLGQKRAQTPAPRRVADSADDTKIVPVGPEYQCRQALQDLIAQKRQIFQVQLLVDRKKKEMERIEQQKRTESDLIAAQLEKLGDLENACHINRSQAEGELVRARRRMDHAIKRRTDLSDQLRRKQAGIDDMQYELFNMEENMEALRRFDQFLCRFDVSMNRADLYQNPSLLLDEISLLENENLRLIERCDALADERENSVHRLERQIQAAEDESEKIREKGLSLPNVGLIDMRTHYVTRDTETADRMLGGLTHMVEKYFRNCFKKSADITALMMLERMENELEVMYATAARLSQAYLAEKQASIDKARREEQRRQKQEAQELEQQRKMKAALERSVQPIHQRVGRPLVARMWPESSTKKNLSKKEEEDEAQEQLLYGELET
jgi:hypothetical protein